MLVRACLRGTPPRTLQATHLQNGPRGPLERPRHVRSPPSRERHQGWSHGAPSMLGSPRRRLEMGRCGRGVTCG